MEAMKKYWVSGTHFQLVSALELESKVFDVVQIWPDKVYVNAMNMAVFLAEVVDKKSEE